MNNIKLFFILLLAASFTLTNCKNEKPKQETTTQEEKLQPAEVEALNATLANMQGKWNSDENASIMMEVNGDKFTTYKDGKMISEEKFVFHNRCPKTCFKENQSGNTFCFTLTDGNAINCYLIRELRKDVSIKYAAIDNSKTFSFTR